MPTKTLTCIADASASQKYLRFYNDADRLAVGAGESSGDDYIAYFKFSDLDLYNTSLYTITSAILTVKKKEGAIGYNSSFNAVARLVTQNWNEGTTFNSWAGRPSTNASYSSSAVSMGTGKTGTVTFDVTNIVQKWQTDGHSYGLAILKTTSGGDKLKTLIPRTETGSAKIEVTYSIANPSIKDFVVNAPGIITEDSVEISWEPTYDVTGLISPSDIYYIGYYSLDNGSTWTQMFDYEYRPRHTVNFRHLIAGDSYQANIYSDIKYKIFAYGEYDNVAYQKDSVSAVGTLDYRIPSLSTPIVISQFGTITDGTVTFQWTHSVDNNSKVAYADIKHSIEIKVGSGNWTYMLDNPRFRDRTQYTVNLKSFLGLSANQYYKQATVQIRTRALAVWHEVNIYSSTSVSDTFSIDYSFAPATPQNVRTTTTGGTSISGAYEGQTVRVHCDALTSGQYNNPLQDGATQNNLAYLFRYRKAGETGVVSIGGSTSPYKDWTIDDICPEDADQRVRFFARVKDGSNLQPDSEQKTSGESSMVTFLVHRHKAPRITKAYTQRTSETAVTVFVQVEDAGYETSSQLSSLVSEASYTLNGSTWVTAVVSVVDDNTVSFSITGLSTPQWSKTIQTKIKMSPPVSGLTAKESEAASTKVYPYRASFFVFTDENNDTRGVGVEALLISGDYSETIEPQDLRLKNLFEVKGNGNASSYPLKINSGGTGANTALAALTNLFNVSPTFSTPEIGTYGSAVSGGYVQFGKLVFVHLTVTSRTSSTTGDTARTVLQGFPTPAEPAAMAVYRNDTDSPIVNAVIATNGRLNFMFSGTMAASSIFRICGVYFAS